MNKKQYIMKEDTIILTNKSMKFVKDLKVGDKVLSKGHKFLEIKKIIGRVGV